MSQSQTQHDFDLTGCETTRLSDPDASGILSLRIEDYHPESFTGFGEPREGVDATLTIEQIGRPPVRHHISGTLLTKYDEWSQDWVTEAWAFSPTATDVRRRRYVGDYPELFQFTTHLDYRWDEWMDDVLDNAYYLQ